MPLTAQQGELHYFISNFPEKAYEHTYMWHSSEYSFEDSVSEQDLQQSTKGSWPGPRAIRGPGLTLWIHEFLTLSYPKVIGRQTRWQESLNL